MLTRLAGPESRPELENIVPRGATTKLLKLAPSRYYYYVGRQVGHLFILVAVDSSRLQYLTVIHHIT